MPEAAVAEEQLEMKIGLGEAIKRLIKVERRYTMQHGQVPEDLLAERDMIIQALDQYTLDLNFTCDLNLKEEVPDNVHVFEHAIKTSCCRMGERDLVPDVGKKGTLERIFDPIIGMFTMKASK